MTEETLTKEEKQRAQARESAKKWRHKNKEKVRAYSAKWYAKNKDKANEYSKKSRQKKRAAVLAARAAEEAAKGGENE
jgi:hypothetical protein